MNIKPLLISSSDSDIARPLEIKWIQEYNFEL